jgi:hypothetical protein
MLCGRGGGIDRLQFAVVRNYGRLDNLQRLSLSRNAKAEPQAVAITTEEASSNRWQLKSGRLVGCQSAIS